MHPRCCRPVAGAVREPLKSIEKIQVPWKSDKNNDYFIWRILHIFEHNFLSSSYNEKLFRQCLVQKIKTHILWSTFCLQKLYNFWNGMKKSTAGQATYYKHTPRMCNNNYCFCTATIFAGNHPIFILYLHPCPVLIYLQLWLLLTLSYTVSRWTEKWLGIRCLGWNLKHQSRKFI